MLLKCWVSLILTQKVPGSYCSSPLGSLQLQTLWRQKYWRHHCYRHFFAAVVAVDVADAGVVVAAVVVVPTSRWSSKMQLFSQKFQTRRKIIWARFRATPSRIDFSRDRLRLQSRLCVQKKVCCGRVVAVSRNPGRAMFRKKSSIIIDFLTSANS